MSAKGESGLKDGKEAKLEKTLRDIEYRFQDDTIEHGIIVDKDGHAIQHAIGDENSVRIDFNLLDGDDVSFTHNHPYVVMDGVSFDVGGFSCEDIDALASHPTMKMLRAVSPHKGYILRRTGDKVRAKEFAEAFRKWYDSYATKSEDYADSLIKSGKIPDTDANYQREAFKHMDEGSSKWFRNHAKEYGYSYSEYKTR